jgi:hypothetical protein
MKTYSWLVLLFLILFLLLRLWSPVSTFAQEESNAPPAQIQLAIDRTTLNVGDSTQGILVLRNTSSYTLTNVTAQFWGTGFTVANPTPLLDSLPPHSSAQAEYFLQSQIAGSHNLIFAVQYSWDDAETGIAHQWDETATVEKIEVTSPFAFKWPDYLIPLVIGALFAQLIAWFTDRQKQRQESRQREEQARGVTLAMLQGVRKGVETQGQVSFNLWDEAIVKGNLYPALHQLGRKIGKPELSKRLAELSITLADYNERQSQGNLTDSLRANLMDELTALITLLEGVS